MASEDDVQSIADELKKLHELVESGVISKEDFERAKHRVIGGEYPRKLLIGGVTLVLLAIGVGAVIGITRALDSMPATERSLVGDWDCPGLTLSLRRSGRFTMEFWPRDRGVRRGTWSVRYNSLSNLTTLSFETPTDSRQLVGIDVVVDGRGKATKLGTFSGPCFQR